MPLENMRKNNFIKTRIYDSITRVILFLGVI
jgi:hypothetical protein